MIPTNSLRRITDLHTDHSERWGMRRWNDRLVNVDMDADDRYRREV